VIAALNPAGVVIVEHRERVPTARIAREAGLSREYGQRDRARTLAERRIST
jgi:hypothetical protein